MIIRIIKWLLIYVITLYVSTWIVIKSNTMPNFGLYLLLDTILVFLLYFIYRKIPRWRNNVKRKTKRDEKTNS